MVTVPSTIQTEPHLYSNVLSRVTTTNPRFEMQLKYLQNILEAQEGEYKIVSLVWSSNNKKLAVATSERQVILFDDEGERRDRFSTKPADSEAGKKSYVIKGLAFSPDSIKLAVAQSDNIVYVYKIGENWGEKKAICNKFPQPSPVTTIVWLSTGPIICGLLDGKVRALQPKSNKSHTLYGSESLVVSLVPNSIGTGFISGHVDCSVIRFFVTERNEEDEPQGRILTHSVPPYALAWVQNFVFAAGCDKRIVVYNNSGRIVKQFDYTKDQSEFEFTAACSSPSGQAVSIGSYDKLRVFAWNPAVSVWEESPTKTIENMYSVTALSWKNDGSKLACGSYNGCVFLFESVLKRTVWKDKLEITYVGPSQVLVRSLEDESKSLVLKSDYGKEIEDLKVMGRDNFIVARTRGTLLVADIIRNLMSEVSWNNSGKNEKFYFENQSACLVFNAGELSLIEYGCNEVLASVRTEFANPHLISVRLNERTATSDNKKLAYLLDLKTICIIDLVYNVGISQINHESKIDWLELNETCHKLLFRDIKQRLLLVDVTSGSKACIYSDVTFVQWVESSDVAIAQSGTTLAVWYNIDLPERPTILNVKGEVVDIVRYNGKTEVCSIDGNASLTFDLDEGLVEFGTAIHDNDYGRAVLFLESIGTSAEAEAMWCNLTNIAIKQHNLNLIDRCYAALGNISKVFCIQNINDEMENGEDYDQNVWAKLSVINGDLETAENIYLEQGDLEAALNMYKKLHKWEDAIRIAQKRGYNKLQELRDEYMSLLLKTGQFEKAGQSLESDGDYDRALAMYMKSNRLVKVANLLLSHSDLMEDHNLVSSVLKKLIKQELYEPAAEIYVKYDKPDIAMECYRKGKVWNKAVDLARVISPDQVITLEEEWGDYLVESKQTDAAISHYIEAGCSLKALDAAIIARQWKKAIHIIQVVEEHESLNKYYSIIGQHLADTKDFTTAENMYMKAKLYKEAVDMYNNSGQWEKAHLIASQYLDKDEVGDMYMKQAEKLETEGKFREAEKLYLAVDSPDLAITMYKRNEQYDNMIRLVELYHPDLLPTTHMHLAQQMESQGKHRAAEIHYLAVGEWKAAMNMYRTLNMWEEAYRVAKQNGGTVAANQVAFLWARTLPIDSAIKLLTKFGILESGVDYACETYQYDFAFQLCKNLPSKKNEVHYNYAMSLEDDGKFNEAETEFILAGKPKEAVMMYTHASDWQSAIRVAETHVPEAVLEVLKTQAVQSFAQKNFSEFESLLLRAQAPELIVQNYKSNEMWLDALRVCKEYLPNLLPALQTEYNNKTKQHNTDSNITMESILSKANELALAGQHKQAIECLLQVSTDITEPEIVTRAMLRAADMVNKFLFGGESEDIIKILAPRLRDMGEYSSAAQLFISADLVKDAVDCFIIIEDWKNAKKIAKELDPSLMNYIEGKYKDRLTKEGNIEQLADVDIMGALDLLAEQGQWVRCIEKAKTFGGVVLYKYVAQYASQLLRDGFTLEALSLFLSHSAPPTPQNFNIYNRIAANIFSMPNISGPDHYNTWVQLRQMLLELVNGIEVAPNIDMKIKIHFQTVLLISHYYGLRCVCRQVQVLKNIGMKISVALLRYTDIIPADKAFYEAGIDLREEGRNSEAFVFLNHYLDICEAIEDGENQLIDHTDLGQTDFPSNVPIPEEMFLHDETDEHDRIREWVLAISMDQKVDQNLPMDERRLYESSLEAGQSPCIVSGYPVKNPAVSFMNSNYTANKDMWSKLTMAAKMYPETNISDAITFIQQWCGNSTLLD
ncbi:PREDICTED: intraflagellar transport protein 172 homolog [Nicrophorus vespilloides]|uniref:Intraflagellar transport protein 172 homolog n=1 Tax=Nicrophorus vespilloides TaxID=110193 RepID=A0ABM1MSL2_NICVS|nr:PREDICTED: intraflagellar transport protein 172 homolog [Nicrophorus vespilloides]